MDEIIISVFYDIDNFCKELKTFYERSLLPCDGNGASFEPPSGLSLSEIMTICVVFHLSDCRTFKWYYVNLIQKNCCKFFPKLITKQKKNTKNPRILRFTDRVLLRKRTEIESVNDFLKNVCQIEHTRHRSGCNFVVNLVAGITVYSFLPKKPSIHTGNMTFA